MHRIFVYGSLKRGMLHHDQLEGARFLCPARIWGWTLVSYEEAYPALVPSGDTDFVHGELYAVDGSLLKRIDAFEDCPRLYQRVRVDCGEGGAAEAYAISRERGGGYRRLGPLWSGDLR